MLGGKGGQCLGLKPLPPSCADCLEIGEPQPSGILRACQAYRDCFLLNILPAVTLRCCILPNIVRYLEVLTTVFLRILLLGLTLYRSFRLIVAPFIFGESSLHQGLSGLQWLFKPMELKKPRFFETLETTYPTTQHHIPEDYNPDHIDVCFMWSLQQAGIAFLTATTCWSLLWTRSLFSVRCELSFRTL
jgi:hypothetical protein